MRSLYDHIRVNEKIFHMADFAVGGMNKAADDLPRGV
jgi:hypothetical protein